MGLDDLTQVSHRMAEAMYKQAGGTPGGGDGQQGGGEPGAGPQSPGGNNGGKKPDGDVIDAEYEER
jgi:molecular chaperone DnaK